MLQVRELTKRGPRPIVYVGLADERIDPYGAPRFAAIERACASEGLGAPTRVNVDTTLESALTVLDGCLQGQSESRPTTTQLPWRSLQEHESGTCEHLRTSRWSVSTRLGSDNCGRRG